MREATDLGVSAGVRRELSGRRIDLTKLKFPVKNGIITIEGELSFVGMEKTGDETAIELKFLESSLKAINGAKEVNFALTNWAKNDAGVWESTQARGSSSSAPTASGDGLYCPDCDFVIRFCPCCGKPLAGAGKSAPSKTRKPVPPIKPIIRKKKPVAPVAPVKRPETAAEDKPLAAPQPAAPQPQTGRPEGMQTGPAPVKQTAVLPPSQEQPVPAAPPKKVPDTNVPVQPAVKPGVPASAKPATPTIPAEKSEPTLPKPAAPIMPTPTAPAATTPPAPTTPKMVEPAAPITQEEKSAKPEQIPAAVEIPEDINQAIDSWNLDPVAAPIPENADESSPFPELFKNSSEEPRPQEEPAVRPGPNAAPVPPSVAPAAPAAPVSPAAPAMPPSPATPAAPVAQPPVQPIPGATTPVAPLNNPEVPDLSDFDANAFDLSQAPTQDKSAPGQDPGAAIPDLEQLDISAFATPTPAVTPQPAPKPPANDGFDFNLDANPLLDTTPATPDERCEFPAASPTPEEDDTPLPPMKPAAPAAPAAPAISPDFSLDDDTPLPPMKPSAPAATAPKPAAAPAPLDLEDDIPLPPLKPVAPASPAAPSPADPFDLDDDTPLPPMKPAAPATPAAPTAADPFDLDDDTPLPPMKPAGQAKPASKDPFAALFTDSGTSTEPAAPGEKAKDPFAALDLDLDVLEVFPSNDAGSAPPQAPASGKPAPPAKAADDNPFNLDNVIDLDSPVEDNKKGEKDPFDLDDFDISKFKI